MSLDKTECVSDPIVFLQFTPWNPVAIFSLSLASKIKFIENIQY